MGVVPTHVKKITLIIGVVSIYIWNLPCQFLGAPLYVVIMDKLIQCSDYSVCVLHIPVSGPQTGRVCCEWASDR